MRALTIVLALATGGAAVAAEPPRTVVNLDRPGVLEALNREHPFRYAKIRKAIDLAQAETCDRLPALFKAQLDIGDLACSPHLLLTSNPPKKHMSFSIDDTRYEINAVQYKLAPARAIRAK